ncbi:MAG: hypothetical protein K2N34_08320 [Lachnospiraceae bacterium]|nr:hypothetical protein [Lachnospiraceae bacterium]
MTEKEFTKLKRFISGRSQDFPIDEAVSHIEKVNRKQKIEQDEYIELLKILCQTLDIDLFKWFLGKEIEFSGNVVELATEIVSSVEKRLLYQKNVKPF